MHRFHYSPEENGWRVDWSNGVLSYISPVTVSLLFKAVAWVSKTGGSGEGRLKRERERGWGVGRGGGGGGGKRHGDNDRCAKETSGA